MLSKTQSPDWLACQLAENFCFGELCGDLCDVQGYFKLGEDRGMPAGHESLKCLTNKEPRWIGDPYFNNKVSCIIRVKLMGASVCSNLHTTVAGHFDVAW